jgi:N-acetyl-1-D-myo-inositol-2-amino-2-deoxy-alpha-D-glucopyranoside deacetylase
VADRPAVLAIYAHPDDELFHGGGMLAHLADRGVRVTLACATRGEAGKAHPSVGPVADLGAHRSEELRRSCQILGFDAPRFLGFHDSARKERLRRDDPRALANVDLLEVETAILGVIRDVRPQVVVTFDPHGGYYHPDHVAVHRAATAAFYSSGAPAVAGDAAPVRLFYSTFSLDVFREHAARTKGLGIVDGLDPEVFGVSGQTAAVVFDARPVMARKLLAFAAHQSAFGVAPEMLADPPAEQARRLYAFAPIMEEELFTLGAVRCPVPRWPLRDVLDGLELR